GLCDSRRLVADGYRRGVPMGSRLNDAAPGSAKPRFLVSAMKDSEGAGLGAVQIVKGWVDAGGETREKVVTVAGSLEGGPSVDPATCAPTAAGGSELCAVWTDEEFDPATPAFWYVRVLEQPTCRWHTHYCQRNGVNPFAADCSAKAAEKGGNFGQCCSDSVERVIRERAWTSPIFWRAG
ncbi:MAG: DUF3604 domain-containing protein, partial [Candidatus Binatia bacterium]